MAGHQDGLKSNRRAKDEFEFQARWTGADEAGMARARQVLDLDVLFDLEVRKLSAGQRRRLSLGRLIASPRPLWLLDEPLAPLDADHRKAFGAVMAEHLAGGGMILAAVHDPLPLKTVHARPRRAGGSGETRQRLRRPCSGASWPWPGTGAADRPWPWPSTSAP